MINPEITDKVVKLFNHMAQSSYAIQVDNELTEELTKTEWRVIQKIGCGMSNKEIASGNCTSGRNCPTACSRSRQVRTQG